MSRESFQHDESRFFSDDPYTVLGLSRNATKEDIDAARTKLQRKFHPDISQHRQALKICQNVNAAYDKLVNKPRNQDTYTASEDDDSEEDGNVEQMEGRVRTIIKNVQTGRGSWQERRAAGRYRHFREHIAKAFEFEPKETGAVDIMLVEFPENRVTSGGVVRWLEEQKRKHPEEYDGYELARPEHLDDLNADPHLAEMTKEEDVDVIALGASTSWEGERRVVRLHAQGDGTRGLGLPYWAGYRAWSRGQLFALVRKARIDLTV